MTYNQFENFFVNDHKNAQVGSDLNLAGSVNNRPPEPDPSFRITDPRVQRSKRVHHTCYRPHTGRAHRALSHWPTYPQACNTVNKWGNNARKNEKKLSLCVKIRLSCLLTNKKTFWQVTTKKWDGIRWYFTQNTSANIIKIIITYGVHTQINTGLRIRITLMRIRIQLFGWMRIRIRLSL
jgi:hypothetical protein